MTAPPSRKRCCARSTAHSHQIAHYYGSEEIAVRNEGGEQIFKTPIIRMKLN